MKKVSILVKYPGCDIMVFKDRKLAEEYLKEWDMQQFENDIWAKLEEDIKLGKYYKLVEKEIIQENHEPKIDQDSQ